MREIEGWREEGVRATGEERAGKQKEDRKAAERGS